MTIYFNFIRNIKYSFFKGIRKQLNLNLRNTFFFKVIIAIELINLNKKEIKLAILLKLNGLLRINDKELR